MSEKKSIVDAVSNNPKLQNIIDELKKKKFLLEGIFHPLAYLRDTDKIEVAWKRKKSRINAIAMGVSLYNEWFWEGINSVHKKGDFIVSKETKSALKRWEGKVKQESALNYEEIEKICSTIGQYMEYMNRKSQGF